MEMMFRCERCRVVKPSLDFRPYTEGGVLVRPDTCAPCGQVVERLRKSYPLDAWLFFLLRRDSRRKQGRKGDR